MKHSSPLVNFLRHMAQGEFRRTASHMGLSLSLVLLTQMAHSQTQQPAAGSEGDIQTEAPTPDSPSATADDGTTRPLDEPSNEQGSALPMDAADEPKFELAPGEVPILIRFNACSPLIAQQVRSFVAIDGRYTPIPEHSQPAPPLRASMTCRRAHALLSVQNQRTERALDNTVRRDVLSVTDFTRLVAISLIELIEASGYRADRSPQTATYQLRGSVQPQERLKAQLAAGIGFGKQDALWSPQLRLSLESRWRSWFLLGIAALAEHNKQPLEPGSAQLTSASGAAYAALRRSSGSLALSAGAGARVGYVRIKGSSSNPSVEERSVDGLWVAPVTIVAAQHQWEAFALRIWLEAGYVTRPVAGLIEEREAVSVDEWLASAGLSVVYSL